MVVFGVRLFEWHRWDYCFSNNTTWSRKFRYTHLDVYIAIPFLPESHYSGSDRRGRQRVISQ